ncbi:helix-turn-helix transcriptional regulator [Pantoea vagans]|uniref:helix-turn-helix transcriptional regulator n=1 Tax=Pantoea vagans TaxID=470934 RepID=UPI003B027D62
MSKNLIRLPEVQRRTGYSKAWIYRLISQKRFPDSVKIGVRAIAFVESEIDEWIELRIQESRSGITRDVATHG